MTRDFEQKKDGITTKARFGTDLREMDRSFDIEFWQSQGDEAIFRAAKEFVEASLKEKGAEPDEYEFQRTIEHFQPTRS